MNCVFLHDSDAPTTFLPPMKDRERDEVYMRMALAEALKAGREGEVPVGAVLTKGNRVLARDHNRCIQRNDPTAHGEILVLRKSGKILKNYRLKDTVLYVTIEPCPMCTSAMVHSRISRLVFGAPEPKFGAVESRFNLLAGGGLNHRIEIERGVLGEGCADVLRRFFREKRKQSAVRQKGKAVGRR